MKPPLVQPDNYHRFSGSGTNDDTNYTNNNVNNVSEVADREADAIVVRPAVSFLLPCKITNIILSRFHGLCRLGSYVTA